MFKGHLRLLFCHTTQTITVLRNEENLPWTPGISISTAEPNRVSELLSCAVLCSQTSCFLMNNLISNFTEVLSRMPSMDCSPLEGTEGWEKYEKCCEGDTTCLQPPGTRSFLMVRIWPWAETGLGLNQVPASAACFALLSAHDSAPLQRWFSSRMSLACCVNISFHQYHL